MQSIKATLEVGSLTETVEVKGGVEIVNTQTPTVSSTLNADQINKMPMATRNALNAVTFLPGVNTSGVNRDSNFNGLPDSFVAITPRRRATTTTTSTSRRKACSRWSRRGRTRSKR